MSTSEKIISQVRATQQAHLLQVLNDEKLSDTTFIIGKKKKRYRVNRIFLAVISPVFETQLCGNSKPDSDIVIKDIDPNAFDCIIKYAYFNDPGLNSENIASVKHLCDKYQIKTLSKHISEIAASNITVNNFLPSFEDAVKYEYNDLIKVYLDHIKRIQASVYHNNGYNKNRYHTYPRNQFCQQLINSEQFLELSQDAIISLLSLNEFAVKDDKIWTRLLKWAQHQSTDDDQKDDVNEERKIELLKSVKTCVRFGLMNVSYFTTNVASLNVLDPQEMLAVFMYIGGKKDNGCANFCTDSRQGAQ